jgi:hypothetical protein
MYIAGLDGHAEGLGQAQLATASTPAGLLNTGVSIPDTYRELCIARKGELPTEDGEAHEWNALLIPTRLMAINDDPLIVEDDERIALRTSIFKQHRIRLEFRLARSDRASRLYAAFPQLVVLQPVATGTVPPIRDGVSIHTDKGHIGLAESSRVQSHQAEGG